MKDNKGMTLIELVIGIAVTSSILLVIFTFYISGVKGFARESTTADNHSRVRRASNDLGRELRRASTVTESSGHLILIYEDGTKKDYYLDDSTINVNYYRENTPGNYVIDHTGILAVKIKKFMPTVSTGKLVFLIESLANAEGQTYQLETEIIIRK